MVFWGFSDILVFVVFQKSKNLVCFLVVSAVKSRTAEGAKKRRTPRGIFFKTNMNKTENLIAIEKQASVNSTFTTQSHFSANLSGFYFFQRYEKRK